MLFKLLGTAVACSTAHEDCGSYAVWLLCPTKVDRPQGQLSFSCCSSSITFSDDGLQLIALQSQSSFSFLITFKHRSVRCQCGFLPIPQVYWCQHTFQAGLCRVLPQCVSSTELAICHVSNAPQLIRVDTVTPGLLQQLTFKVLPYYITWFDCPHKVCTKVAVLISCINHSMHAGHVVGCYHWPHYTRRTIKWRMTHHLCGGTTLCICGKGLHFCHPRKHGVNKMIFCTKQTVFALR